MTKLAAFLLAAASPALAQTRGDWSSLEQARTASALSAQGASAACLEDAKFGSDQAVEGERESPADSPQGRRNRLQRSGLTTATAPRPDVPPVEGTGADGGGAASIPKPPKWAVYAGAGILGGLGAALTGGIWAGLGGAAVGIGAAYLFEKGDYGAAFGTALGGIVGSFMGGPLGGLIGAVVGGFLGHFVGKLFH